LRESWFQDIALNAVARLLEIIAVNAIEFMGIIRAKKGIGK